ncbi:bifunctional pyr operon transcriptional regulator/uracil phosphoribosyltransferase PyrR [Opitutaceae bacterium EW11]|nr:bifunctional pyr operon transcriptional regulator/uracil phosphoribosyltransferase PyrR [Opitutaceae bacterium EW11]
MPDTRRIAEHEIRSAIERVANEISTRHAAGNRLILLGIANGGIELAKRISAKIPKSRAGVVDISFHRDDIGRHPIPKEFAPTHIPGDVNGATVILVDDVLFSGRTAKAALDELFDHGRPASVELAVLVDRGGRRLPLAADYCGIKIATSSAEKVIVTLDSQETAKDSIIVRSAS